MDIKEAYRVMHANCGIELGDTVIPLFKFKPRSLGYKNNWTPGHAEMIGRECTVVKDDGNNGFALELEGGPRLHFPCFALELVEKVKPKLPPIMVGGNEVKFIHDPFPVIEVCGVTVHKATLEEMLKRLEGEN